MICPNCHSEYTSLNPCGCASGEFLPPPEDDWRVTEPGPSPEVKDAALRPTGINDPFWH